MALSEDEQRLLEQLEASLAKDDPKLAHTLRGTRPKAPLSTRATLGGGAGFVVGLALLVGGIQLHWTISVVGFLVMLASMILAFGAWRPGQSRDDEHGARAERPEASTASSSHFMDRLEERWRRREDDGR